MRILRKKTQLDELEALIERTGARGEELSWDRYERQVPQCAFGQVGLCCHGCSQGPCRVDPFDRVLTTVCGRDRNQLVGASLVQAVVEGAWSHWHYVARGTPVPEASAREAPAWFTPWARERWSAMSEVTLAAAGEMAREGVAGGQLWQAGFEAGVAAVSALLRIAEASSPSFSPRPRIWQGWFEGAEGPRVLIVGRVAPSARRSLQDTLQEVRWGGAAGGEADGVPPVADYLSMEALLANDLADGVVWGDACVPPAAKALAARRGIPSRHWSELGRFGNEFEQSVRKRYREVVDNPVWARHAGGSVLGLGRWWVNAGGPLESVAPSPRGLAWLGGCGNVKATHGGELVRQARALVESGWLVLASGCAAAVLAGAGYMSARAGTVSGVELRACCREWGDRLGTGPLPPVWDLGNCWDATVSALRALALARAAGWRTLASFPEISRPAAWCTAVAAAALGTPTCVGPLFPLDGTPEARAEFQAALAEVGGACLAGPAQLREAGSLLAWAESVARVPGAV